MLKLKLQYFSHLMWRTGSLEKTMMLSKIEGQREGDDRGWYGWMASPTQWSWVLVNSRNWWWTRRPGMLQSKGSQRVRHDWTELIALATMWSKLCLTTSVSSSMGASPNLSIFSSDFASPELCALFERRLEPVEWKWLNVYHPHRYYLQDWTAVISLKVLGGNWFWQCWHLLKHINFILASSFT